MLEVVTRGPGYSSTRSLYWLIIVTSVFEYYNNEVCVLPVTFARVQCIMGNHLNIQMVISLKVVILSLKWSTTEINT